MNRINIKNKSKKQNHIIIGILCFAILLTSYVAFLCCKTEETQSYNSAVSGLAIYIKNNDTNGNYVSNSTVPTSNYELNTTLTHCVAGSTVSYANGTVTYNLRGEDYCYLYFDSTIHYTGNSTDGYHITSSNAAKGIISLSSVDTSIATDTHGDYTNYRYTGANPDNYACMTEDGETCINYDSNDRSGLFRIIGVFNEDTHGKSGQQLVKLITADSIGNMPFDYKQTGVGSSSSDYGSNDWSDSQLMYMLNGFRGHGGYDSSGNRLHTDYTWDNSTGNITDGTYTIYTLANGNNRYLLNGVTTVNKPAAASTSSGYTSSSLNITSLTSAQSRMIETVTWHLGGTGTYNTVSTGLASNLYNYERGSSTCSSAGNCSKTRPTTWTGKIGLIYPSDYGYATDNDTCINSYFLAYHSNESSWTKNLTCGENDWILYTGSSSSTAGTATLQWTISPVTTSSTWNMFVRSEGIYDYEASNNYGIRPSFYLKSNTKIIGGSGTSDDPYMLYRDIDAAQTIRNLYSSTNSSQNTANNVIMDDNDDVRFTGENPNNYACLSIDGTNCINYTKGDASTNTAGLFRIVGSTYGVRLEQGSTYLLKLTTADAITKTYFDYKGKGTGSTSSTVDGSTDWSDSQLMYMLNGFVNKGYGNTGSLLHTGYSYDSSTYYVSDGSHNIYKLYYGRSYSSGLGNYVNKPKYYSSNYSTDVEYIKNLSATQVNMVEDVLYYLAYMGTGTHNLNNLLHYERVNITAEDRAVLWKGKTGLLFYSDYVGSCTDWNTSTKTCGTLTWINYPGSRTGATASTATDQWLLTYDSSNNLYRLNTSGGVTSSSPTVISSVRPTFYLKSNTKINGGDGTSSNPYIIMLNEN